MHSIWPKAVLFGQFDSNDHQKSELVAQSSSKRNIATPNKAQKPFLLPNYLEIINKRLDDLRKLNFLNVFKKGGKIIQIFLLFRFDIVWVLNLFESFL